RLRLRRGTVDDSRRHRELSAGARSDRRSVSALQLARRRRVLRPSAIGDALSVRRARRSAGWLMKILVIDVGGTHIKILASGHRTAIKIPSGSTMTAKMMVRLVRKSIDGWKYSHVSIGYPGVVMHGKPAIDPRNLAPGWVGFDFGKAFGCPVKVI